MALPTRDIARSPLAVARCRSLLATALLVATSGCGLIADSHNRKGVRSAYRGDYQSAMASFQKAVARDPKNSDAHYNMAASLHKIGKQTGNQQYLQQAEQLYNQSLDNNSGNVDAYRGLAVLLAETQRSEKAFTLMKHWVRSDPTNPEPHTELARLYNEFKDKDAAIAELQAALRIDHQNARALTALAALRESEGNRMQALEIYQRAYAAQPRPEVANRIASLQQSVGPNMTAPPGVALPSAPGTQLASPTQTPRY